MARKVAKSKSVGSATEDMALALRDALGKGLGSNDLCLQEKQIDDIYGLPLTGLLPLQYLFGVDTLPFERVYELVGKKGSFKSSFGWFLCSLLLRYVNAPGHIFFEDSERKTNWRQIRSVLKNDGLLSRVYPVSVVSDEDCCRALTVGGKAYDTICPERDYPAIFFIDSIGNLTTASAQEAMDKTGVAAGTGFEDAHKANTLSKQFKTWTAKYLEGKPIMLISVNHVHVKMDGQSGGAFKATEYVTPGGVLKDYAATTQLMLSSESTSQIKTADRVKLRIKTLKSALSATGKSITVIVETRNCTNDRYPEGDHLSSRETADHVQRDYTTFDWDTALFELVTATEKEQRWPKEAMQKILQLSADNKSSKRLGVKDLSPKEMGAAIHANPEVVSELQDLFGIHRERAFTPHGIITPAVHVPVEVPSPDVGDADGDADEDDDPS